jgi:hypothetical protein
MSVVVRTAAPAALSSAVHNLTAAYGRRRRPARGVRACPADLAAEVGDLGERSEPPTAAVPAGAYGPQLARTGAYPHEETTRRRA